MLLIIVLSITLAIYPTVKMLRAAWDRACEDISI